MRPPSLGSDAPRHLDEHGGVAPTGRVFDGGPVRESSRGGPLAPAPPGRGGTGQVLHEHHHQHHHEHDGAAGTSSRVGRWPTWAIAGRGLVLSEEFAEADVSLLASVVGGPLRLPQRGPERRGRCRSGCAGWRRARPAGLVEVARNADRRSGRARVGSADPGGCLPGRSPCKVDLSGHGLPGAPPLWTPPWPLRGGPWTPARWRRAEVLSWVSHGREFGLSGGAHRGSAERWSAPGQGRGRAFVVGVRHAWSVPRQRRATSAAVREET